MTVNKGFEFRCRILSILLLMPAFPLLPPLQISFQLWKKSPRLSQVATPNKTFKLTYPGAFSSFAQYLWTPEQTMLWYSVRKVREWTSLGISDPGRSGETLIMIGRKPSLMPYAYSLISEANLSQEWECLVIMSPSFLSGQFSNCLCSLFISNRKSDEKNEEIMWIYLLISFL